MSKIDELIAELCPEGVRHYELSAVAEYSKSRVDSVDLDETNFVGVDNLVANKGGKVDASYPPNTARLTAYEPGDVLLGNIRPYLKKVWLADSEGGCSGDVLAIRILSEFKALITPCFMYYLLSSDAFFAYNMQHAKGAKMPRGNKPAIMNYRIPVPPLEIQRHIADILDKFTQLEAELEAELEARRKQYSFYRDSLLTFTERELRWLRMSEVATIVRGASPRPIRSFLTTSESGIPWIKIGDVPSGGKFVTNTTEKITTAGAEKSRFINPGDFILSNSMSFGRPYISKITGCIHDGWLAISDFSDSFVSDFLYHLLRSSGIQKELKRLAGNGGTVSNLNADMVRNLTVPVPPLEEQKKIVAVLDKFEVLVNDLTIGLPAELNARRQQYEYFRDKLLTFKELEPTS